MLQEPSRAMELLRCAVILDVMCNLRKIGFRLDKPKLQALVAHEQRHSLNRNRVNRVGEVEQRIFEHLHRFLCVSETTLREADNALGLVVNLYFLVLNVTQRRIDVRSLRFV